MEMNNNTTASIVPSFAYNDLDAETRIVVMQRTTEIKATMRRAASDIIDIGQKLIEVKARLQVKDFVSWFEAEFGWNRSTAYRFMQVAERFGGSSQIETMAPSALYLLAAPSTPDEAREEALERAAGGEEIKYKTAQAIVEQYRPFQSAPPVPTEPMDLSDMDWGGAEDPYSGVQVQVQPAPYGHQEHQRPNRVGVPARIVPQPIPVPVSTVVVRFQGIKGTEELGLNQLDRLPPTVAEQLCDALRRAGWLDGTKDGLRDAG